MFFFSLISPQFAKYLMGKFHHMNEKMLICVATHRNLIIFGCIIHNTMTLMGQTRWWVRSETNSLHHHMGENMFCFIAHLVANVEFIISWCKCLREKLLAWPPKNVWCNIKNESLHFTKFLWQAINKQFIINKDNYIMLNLNITVNTYYVKGYILFNAPKYIPAQNLLI